MLKLRSCMAVLLISGWRSAFADCPTGLGQLAQAVHSFSREMQRMGMLADSVDMASFCQRHVFRGVSAMNEKIDSDKVEEFRTNDEANCPGADLPCFPAPWEMSTYPKKATTEGAYALTLKALDLLLKRPTGQIFEKPIPLTAMAVEEINSSVRKAMANESNDSRKDMTSGFLGLSATILKCGKLTRHAFNCARNVERVKEIMGEKGQFFSLLPVYQEVLTHGEYQEGLRQFSQQLMQDMRSGAVPRGDVLGDLKAAFTKTGVTAAKAEGMAWNVMGILASGGPNTLSRLSRLGAFEQNPMVASALSLLGGALPALDFRSSASGHFYSYPPSVKTSCNNGKPYHFWMSAFLTRQLTQETGDADASAAAVYLAQEGYQALAMTGDRKPERVLYVPSSDSFNHVMRMDLTYASAGTSFGAAAAQGRAPRALSIDQGVRQLLRNAGFPPLMSYKEAFEVNQAELPGMIKVYSHWEETISPHSVYEFHLR